MNPFRSLTNSTDRPSVKIQLKMKTRLGVPLDASQAWEAIKAAFASHPDLEVYQAKISPDKEADSE